MITAHQPFERARRWTCATLLAAVVASVVVFGEPVGTPGPRLVVMLVVDQMRGDYVDKLQANWTGGFRRLLTDGAWFRQADYPYARTVTCAGHATVSTGSYPAVHGMTGNSWWDRGAKHTVACADDDASTIVSYGSPLTGRGESARALRTSTLADELRAQLDPAAKVVTLSLKARSAVTLAGQRADASVWLDDRGSWVTSSAYTAAPVPAVAAFLKSHPLDADFQQTWDRLLPIDRYLFEPAAVGIVPKGGMTDRFPHRLGETSGEPDTVFFNQWQSSPNADAYLADMALAIATQLQLGRAGHTDFLGISFSTLDKVGHDFGPRSHEIQDVLLLLDRTLDRLFAGLDQLVGKDQYVVSLTADHGVAPVPESARMLGLDANRLSPLTIADAIERELAVLGPGKHVASVESDDVYLTPRTWTQVKATPGLVERLRARLLAIRGVAAVYTRDDLANATSASDPITRRMAASFRPDRSGDLMVLLQPYWLASGTGTNHGTPYGYDTRVPILLMGPHITPGQYLQPASPADIAPTLAFLSGVTLPNAQGRVLAEALAK
ncbi:MAG TPA: alkaline phosphatase family protein [Vicinamibacterales bacterium]|nr:alkaline phosphatase family protein [Vicinamibacterales bacterium]